MSIKSIDFIKKGYPARTCGGYVLEKSIDQPQAAALWLTAMLIFMAASPAGASTSAKSHRAPFKYSASIRAYYFTRSFRQGTDQSAVSLGGNFHLEDDLLPGIGAGLTFGSANPLGLNNVNPKFVDAGLPGTTLSVLEELYAQYRSDFVTLRVGRQILRTPWANPSDSRMIPNAFQGVGLNAQAGNGWSFSANRMVRFKQRVGSTFANTDLLAATPTAGMLNLGASYSEAECAFQAWHYDFYGTASLEYMEATQRFATREKYRPFISAQYIAENGTTFRLPANVNAHGYGVATGVTTDRGDLAVSYNNVPAKSHTFNNGGFASPYTYTDNDPLFTTLTGTGLVDKGAGHAYRLAGTLWSFHHRIRAFAGRAEYYIYAAGTAPATHVLDTNLDVTLYIGNAKRAEAFRGLLLRDRWIDVETQKAPFTFINNRAQIEYDF